MKKFVVLLICLISCSPNYILVKDIQQVKQMNLKIDRVETVIDTNNQVIYRVFYK